MALTVGFAQAMNLYSGQNYLPYSAGLLEASARRGLTHPDRFDFLLTVWDRTAIDDAVSRLERADLVLFSVYVWNFQWSLAVAKALKQSNPEVVIGFGGPHVPDAAESFLRLYPFIDLACHREGERMIVPLLEACRDRRWRDVPSVSYLDAERTFFCNPLAPRIKRLDEIPSPYLEGVFAPLMETWPDAQWLMLLETNRGCPYGCTFCDWGSATQSKLYQFGLERIFAELEWAGRHKIDYIFCCDANFGILSRDVEIVNHAARVKQQYGFPRVLSVQTAKTRPEGIYRVWKAIIDQGLNLEAAMPLQSVDEVTLGAVKRINMPLPSFRALNQRFARDDIRTYTDVIIGLPGETYEAFADSVGAIIAHGQHHRLQYSNLTVLPNAEMATPEDRARYGLETVPTRVVSTWSIQRGADETPEMQELVVGTAAMPREDWVRSRVLAWTSIILHFYKTLQVPFALIHRLGGVGYRVLIEAFTGESVAAFPLLRDIQRQLVEAARAIQRGEPEYTPSERLPGIWLPADDLAMTLLHVDGRLPEFFAEARKRLSELLDACGVTLPPGLLEEAIALNARLIGGGAEGETLALSYNLWEVFDGYIRGEDTALRAGRFRYTLVQSPDFYHRVRPLGEEVAAMPCGAA